MQPSLGINFIIALQGIFPSQGFRSLEEAEEGDEHVDLDDPGRPESQSHRRLGDQPFIGEIAMFAGNFAPVGWAFCNGQIVPLAQNTALFALLGTTYGGNGQTTFGLPDLRGRVPIGIGQGPGLSDQSLGQVFGSEAITLSANNLPGHTHGVPTITAITVGAVA
jgi:microcystin-dependent protein